MMIDEGGVTVVPEHTLRQALTLTTEAFDSVGIVSAATDARFLLQGILQLDATEIFRNPDRQIGAQAKALNAAVLRRLKYEPVSRILGAREFYGRTFEVTPDVLDPRPDTECLVDLVLEIVRADPALQQNLTIADIGTGSGAIIATLLAELAFARGIATDVSRPALEVARANAANLGVLDRLSLIETRGLSGVNVAADIVVSNPPYIASLDIDRLDVDVKDFDPHVALDGGADGLEIYREIANDIKVISKPCWVILEFGVGQLTAVEGIFADIGAASQHRRADLGGHVRCVALRIHR
jgi:release factor glutamine methyltransferase